jgi:voltage-gated potassium channel
VQRILFQLLGDVGTGESGARRFVSAGIMVAIIARIAAVMLQTVPVFVPYDAALQQVIDVTSIIFMVEYFLRMWVETGTSVRRRTGNMLGYATSFMGVVDLLVFLPFVAERFFDINPDFLILPESLAVLKLTRYAPGLGLLVNVFRREARALWAALITLIVALVLTSSLMYVLEHRAQPQMFYSLPDTVWWGIVTMSTVGYGDMVPATPFGKFIGGIFMLLGIAMFAVPAGLLASGFSEELKNNEFFVTWQTVAQVPLFRRLDAELIASIARLLQPKKVPANSVIVRRNDRALALYFVMSGEVNTDTDPDIRFTEGDFFGEVALMNDIRHNATLIAVTETRLLILGVADFRKLIRDNPDIQAALEARPSAV